MAIGLKKIENDDKLKKRFNRKIVVQNSWNFIVLTITLTVFQIILMIAKRLGIIKLSNYSTHAMIIMISFCILASIVLLFFTARAKKSGKTSFLTIVMVSLHIFLLLYGTHYTATMYSNGTHSFSVYIIMAFFVSLSHVRWPLFTAVSISSMFFGLVVLLKVLYEVPADFAIDVTFSAALVVLICVASILNYRRYMQLYMKEKEIVQMNKKLVEISEKDALTGLCNRRKILGKIDELISYSKSCEADFSVVMMDIDKFKKINDKFGHGAGDIVLKEFSKIISNNLRERDVFGRWGGEEFLMLLPNTNEKSAFTLVDRLREKVQKHDFGELGTVTFSAGICGLRQKYTIDNMIDKADFALYISKQLGRNKVSIFEAA